MEFFAIIGIATLFLLWLISGPARVRRTVRDEETEAAIFKRLQPELPPSSKDAWQWQPSNKAEYSEALELYQRDPAHNPYPSLPPESTF